MNQRATNMRTMRLKRGGERDKAGKETGHPPAEELLEASGFNARFGAPSAEGTVGCQRTPASSNLTPALRAGLKPGRVYWIPVQFMPVGVVGLSCALARHIQHQSTVGKSCPVTGNHGPTTMSPPPADSTFFLPPQLCSPT